MRRQTTYSAADIAAQLPLTPAVFPILLALADQDRYGHAIVLDIAERTGGAIADARAR